MRKRTPQITYFHSYGLLIIHPIVHKVAVTWWCAGRTDRSSTSFETPRFRTPNLSSTLPGKAPSSLSAKERMRAWPICKSELVSNTSSHRRGYIHSLETAGECSGCSVKRGAYTYLELGYSTKPWHPVALVKFGSVASVRKRGLFKRFLATSRTNTILFGSIHARWG